MDDGQIKNLESRIRVLRTLSKPDIFIPLVEEEQLSPNEYSTANKRKRAPKVTQKRIRRNRNDRNSLCHSMRSLISSVRWDQRHEIAQFEYDSDFVQLSIEPSPLMMPIKEGRVYSFGKLDKTTFKGLTGMLTVPCRIHTNKPSLRNG